jgi:hypothetical protein
MDRPSINEAANGIPDNNFLGDSPDFSLILGGVCTNAS